MFPSISAVWGEESGITEVSETVVENEIPIPTVVHDQWAKMSVQFRADLVVPVGWVE